MTADRIAPDKPCPTCGGEVVVSGKTAWCVHRYSAGGCGSTWQATKQGWRQVR